MYFEPEKKACVQRANNEFLRRMLGGETVDGASACPVMNMGGEVRPQLPPEENRPSCDGSYRPSCDGSYRPGEDGGACPKHIHAPSLAMVYAPRQCWQNLLDPVAGWKEGSIFAELILPLEAEKRSRGTEVRPCR